MMSYDLWKLWHLITFRFEERKIVDELLHNLVPQEECTVEIDGMNYLLHWNPWNRLHELYLLHWNPLPIMMWWSLMETYWRMKHIKTKKDSNTIMIMMSVTSKIGNNAKCIQNHCCSTSTMLYTKFCHHDTQHLLIAHTTDKDWQRSPPHPWIQLFSEETQAHDSKHPFAPHWSNPSSPVDLELASKC